MKLYEFRFINAHIIIQSDSDTSSDSSLIQSIVLGNLLMEPLVRFMLRTLPVDEIKLKHICNQYSYNE